MSMPMHTCAILPRNRLCHLRHSRNRCELACANPKTSYATPTCATSAFSMSARIRSGSSFAILHDSNLIVALHWGALTILISQLVRTIRRALHLYRGSSM